MVLVNVNVTEYSFIHDVYDAPVSFHHEVLAEKRKLMSSKIWAGK